MVVRRARKFAASTASLAAKAFMRISSKRKSGFKLAWTAIEGGAS